MLPTGCEHNTTSRFSNISRTSWNGHFAKSMSPREVEREEVIGGSGSDHGSVGDDSLACMTSYLWNSVRKTRHLSITSCGRPQSTNSQRMPSVCPACVWRWSSAFCVSLASFWRVHACVERRAHFCACPKISTHTTNDDECIALVQRRTSSACMVTHPANDDALVC